MMKSIGLAALLIWVAALAQADQAPSAATSPADAPQARNLVPLGVERPNPLNALRIGGVFTMGLRGGGGAFSESSILGETISEDNIQWLAAHCDVVALSPSTITRDSFRLLRRTRSLVTPLLYVHASSLSEEQNRGADVGGWRPEMAAWTLQNRSGREVPNPDRGEHWMDFSNSRWAAHWRDRVISLVNEYQAEGVVAAELPVGNTFVGDDLAKYRTFQDRADATYTWLGAARAVHRFLMVPSASGFDAVAGHAVLAPPPGAEQESLAGRLWDEYFPLIDGSWADGWIHPYWMKEPLPEKFWEMEMEAADRAALRDQVFIVSVGYRDRDELEYAVASYLLIAHRQGRLVLHPMPMRNRRNDAGFSLAVFKEEVAANPTYFDVPLGYSVRQRQRVQAIDGVVWRRVYAHGQVYVNPSDIQTVRVSLGGPMQRLDGSRVNQVTLKPHSGAVLLYDGGQPVVTPVATKTGP